MKRQAQLQSQNGAVTLLTALVILIAISLVALLSSKTVLVETQIEAGNYQMRQAVAAANAGFDAGVGYFNDGGFDQDGTVGVDDPTAILGDKLCYPYGIGDQKSRAIVTFDNTAGTRCVAAGLTPDMKSGMITATGCADLPTSNTICNDSCVGKPQRTISQCVGSIDPFGGNAPKQSLVTHGAVGLTGNYTVINRFNNTTVWSGQPMNTWGSAQTYIRPNGHLESEYNKEQLQDGAINNNYTSPPITEWANNASTKGLGVDVIADDPRLGALTRDEFFDNFFAGNRQYMYDLAKSANQVYDTFPSAGVASGVVWVGPKPGDPIGNFTVTGGTYGSRDTNTTTGNPVIMIVNGNLVVHGNFEVNGMLYVAGTMDANGTPNIYGSVIVEDPAGVTGNGTVKLIYTPYTLEKSSNPPKGTTTVISGSWRDW